MITIIPAILARDQASLEARIRALEPYTSLAQLDVINNTLIAGESYADVSCIESLHTTLRFEVHLMVHLSSYDLAQWHKPWVDRIIIHGEASGVREASQTIRSWGKPVIVACNPDTHCTDFKSLIEYADGIMFMTVAPGAMGNEFRHDVVERIAKFHAQYPDSVIEVDGGVTPVTITQLMNAGATRFAVGSYIDSNHVGERIQTLMSAVPTT